MRALNANLDALSRSDQTDCVTLDKPGDPNIVPQFENKVRVGLVRFRAVYLAIIHFRGETGPGGFVQNTPFLQNVSLEVELYDHIESSVGDEEIAIAGRRHMVEVIETGQGYITDSFK